MAPVVESLVTLLAFASAVQAGPLSPGRHAPPYLTGLSHHASAARRAVGNLIARYYGDVHGLSRPGRLPEKRAPVIPSGWSYMGCVKESEDQRLLNNLGFYTPSMTLETCMIQCEKSGFTYAGLEYGDECYCASSFTGNGGASVPESTCSMPCAGDASAICGNGWYLSLYSFNATDASSGCTAPANPAPSNPGNATATGTALPGNATATGLPINGTATATGSAPNATVTGGASVWTSLGCAVDASNARVLDEKSVYDIPNMTVDSCQAMCETSGFKYAGVEYGMECHCGNKLRSDVSYSGWCYTPCAGDSSENCGGGWSVEVYELTKASTGTATGTATATAPTATITDPATGGDQSSEWFSLGCAVDSDQARVLSEKAVYDIADMTVDSCLTICEDSGFKYAGVEYGSECHCGNKIRSDVRYQGWCYTPCAGDASENCGGGWSLEVFELLASGDAECDATSYSITSTLVAGGAFVTPTGAANATTTAKTAVSDTKVAVPTTKATVPTTKVAVPTTTAKPAATTKVDATPASSTVAPVSTNVPASPNTHQVWAHHMVGNTYSYSQADWAADIADAHANGIDGFALNMGSDWWQPARVNDAYEAAKASGTDFKMFLSLDMTSLGCWSGADATNLVNLVKRWAGHSAQAIHKNKVLVSTFAGSDCTFSSGGSHGWQREFKDVLSAQGVDTFFMPSVFSDISTFSSASWMDAELNWNSGWPMGSSPLDTSSDVLYRNALGGKEYVPAISPAFFTHFPVNGWNKNWIFRGDDWLYATRWEQIIAMRDVVQQTEILTYNDYGESSYIGPIKGDLPAGSDAWTIGYDHQGWNLLTKYYSTAFKTGSYPAITKDSITMWSRPHPKAATASSDSTGRPSGWEKTDDNLYAVVMTTGPAIVSLTSGSTTTTFSVQAGLSKLKVPSNVGSISGSINRNDAAVASYNAGNAFSYTNSPVTYNFNYFVGSSS